MAEIILGQLPEALYFALFIIYARKLKEKRLELILLSMIMYLIWFNTFPYSIWSHVLYFVTFYIVMKCLYKNKCQITDIFTLGIASIGIIFTSVITFALFHNILTNFIGNFIQKGLLFLLFYLVKNKLYNITILYKKLWNRSKIKYKMKSTTFRAANVLVLNIAFYVISIGMIFILLVKGGN